MSNTPRAAIHRVPLVQGHPPALPWKRPLRLCTEAVDQTAEAGVAQPRPLGWSQKLFDEQAAMQARLNKVVAESRLNYDVGLADAEIAIQRAEGLMASE